MVTKIIITVFILVGALNFLHANTSCSLIEKATLAISVHASNWSNSMTTRVPEGGTYKLKTILCNHSGCEIREQGKFIMVYEPNHPDADVNGYVKYPDIDKNKEYKLMSAQAQILREFGPHCPQKVKVLNNKNSALIEYKSGRVKHDVFNFKKDSNLVSWLRESTDNDSRILNFN